MDQKKVNQLVAVMDETQVALAEYTARLKKATSYEESRKILSEGFTFRLKAETNVRKVFRAVEYLLGSGSTRAQAGQFINCVAVGNEEDGFFGSGVLLTKDWLLTSSHCRGATKMFPGMEVNVTGQEFAITLMAEKGLLALFSVTGFNENVPPPKLPSDNCKLKRDTKMMVVGFGDTDPYGGGYGQRRYARFVVDNALNVRIYASSESAVCPGDSGGPAYYADEAGTHDILLGIADSITGDDCAGGGGVFATVVGYRTWINDNTGLALGEACPPLPMILARSSAPGSDAAQPPSTRGSSRKTLQPRPKSRTRGA
jgi:secreted trypsin-like serine protease